MTPEERQAERLARRRARYAERRAAGLLPARDYRAEERRRNALAQERGFPTRAALRGARRRGELPSAREERRQRSQVNPWTGSVLTDADLRHMRRRSQEWSNKHSRSERSKYNPRWSDEKVVLYYMVYVAAGGPEAPFGDAHGFRATKDEQNADMIAAMFATVYGLTTSQIYQYKYVG